MAITVKHKFVSAIPDSTDATIVRPSNWNDDHQLTGTVPVANGGTGASTLTGYVSGNGTSAMTASTTIPNSAITGLGTMSTQNANNVTITGGSLNSVAIGQSVAGDGSFDVLVANVTRLTNVTSSAGIVITGTFSGSAPTDGLVMDYATGWGRFSDFGGDGFQWFNNGLATNKLMELSASGVLTTTADASIHGLTVGLGAGSQAQNTVVGVALYSNTTGNYNTVVGTYSMANNTSGIQNSVFGYQALSTNTSGGSNTAIGGSTLQANTTASNNTAVGFAALNANTTASNNTAVGYQAGYSNTTAQYNTFLGYQAGYNFAGTGDTTNAFISSRAGYNQTSGTANTYVGEAAGFSMTTGSKNSILGRFGGNQGGLDIRTASNYIVLSDGDGNPRGIFNSTGNFIVGAASDISETVTGCEMKATGQLSSRNTSGSNLDCYKSTTGTAVNFVYSTAGTTVGTIVINASSTTYNTSSDYRLKNVTGNLSGYKERIMALQPKQGTWKADGSEFRGFVAHEFATQYPSLVSGEKDAVDEKGKPVYQGMQAGGAETIADLVAFVQELKAEVDALKAGK